MEFFMSVTGYGNSQVKKKFLQLLGLEKSRSRDSE